jgi:hypothetical protein
MSLSIYIAEATDTSHMHQYVAYEMFHAMRVKIFIASL